MEMLVQYDAIWYSSLVAWLGSVLGILLVVDVVVEVVVSATHKKCVPFCTRKSLSAPRHWHAGSVASEHIEIQGTKGSRIRNRR